MVTEEVDSLELRLGTDVAGDVGGLDCRRYDAVVVSHRTEVLLL